MSNTQSKTIKVFRVTKKTNNGYLPEAPTLTTDKQLLYYHQKDNTLLHKIYLRYRINTTGINEQTFTEELNVFPNPTNNNIRIAPLKPNEAFVISLYNTLGQKVLEVSDTAEINISDLTNGIYYLLLKQKKEYWTTKIIKE